MMTNLCLLAGPIKTTEGANTQILRAREGVTPYIFGTHPVLTKFIV